MSTSISSLPNELSIEKNKDPVTLNVKERQPSMTQPVTQPIPTDIPNKQAPELSKDSINKIIQGLQDASSSGSTALQSRDIPMSMENITHDFTARPNYVPAAEKSNFIQDDWSMETLIKQKREQKNNQMEFFYDEIQIPLLVMVLFFVFSLPIFKNSMVQNFPAFFLRSGNYNLKGLTFTTILFGFMYYFIIKTIKYLSEI